jgi:hypothetical protein
MKLRHNEIQRIGPKVPTYDREFLSSIRGNWRELVDKTSFPFFLSVLRVLCG